MRYVAIAGGLGFSESHFIPSGLLLNSPKDLPSAALCLSLLLWCAVALWYSQTCRLVGLLIVAIHELLLESNGRADRR